jgi:radical SAM protein with 4Fe4S-binding SPASM domain
MNLAAGLLAIRRPCLVRERVRAAVRFRSDIRPRLRRGDPTAPPPLLVSFNLTHLCNLRCAMCGQWRRQDTGRTETLPLAALKRIADEVAPFRPKIYIWGGEPLLHPALIPFLEHLKARKLYTVINTNGVVLERFAPDLVRIGVDSLDISIDGPPEVHDRVRGVAGTFQRLQAGAEKVGEEARRRGKRPPLLKAVSVVTESTLDRLGEMFDLLRRGRLFDLAIVNLGWFTSAEANAANERIFAERLGVPARSGKDFIGALGRVDAAKVKQLMKQAARIRFPVVFRPSLPPAAIEGYYADPGRPVRRRFCYSPWEMIDIRPDGSAVFCPDYPDYSVGNVREEPLLSVWNGEKARRFRRSLLDHGLFPICARCCGLYDHGF